MHTSKEITVTKSCTHISSSTNCSILFYPIPHTTLFYSILFNYQNGINKQTNKQAVIIW